MLWVEIEDYDIYAELLEKEGTALLVWQGSRLFVYYWSGSCWREWNGSEKFTINVASHKERIYFTAVADPFYLINKEKKEV